MSIVIDGDRSHQSSADFKLISKDGSFIQVQKFILAARSPVFAALFTEEVEPNHVMDLTFSEMNQFVKFIYTGELEGLFTYGLLQSAIAYKMKTLEYLCLSASKKVHVDQMAWLALQLETAPMGCELESA